jgi:hypothetical protein
MALEEIGDSLNVDRLKSKLKKRYPNHNFDIPPEPDRKCKMNGICPPNKITYTDTEGNLFCGHRYKKTDKEDIYKWEFATCHALLMDKKPDFKTEEIPF